ncbi:MAG: hypothetical protein OXU22_06660 [Gammaproteobacteria bacterium]|nr:hypothetical protein [Gammaproteobacteria bacterium]
MSLMQTFKYLIALVNNLVNPEQKKVPLDTQFEEKIKEYSLEQVHRCIVYKHKTKSDWYACPHCAEKDRQIHILQPFTEIQHKCFSCGEYFQLLPDQTDYGKHISIDSSV